MKKDHWLLKKSLVVAVVIIMVSLSIVSLYQSNINNSLNNKAETSSSSASNSSTIYISPGPTPAFTDNFNPFNGPWNSPAGIMGLMYEPLLQINTYNGTVIPWLATNYTWNSNATVLTMHLRQNVSFSNGMKFNATDVVYTFNEQKNLMGQWSVLKSVVAVNQYEVKFTFKSSNSQYLFYIGSNFIIPKALFSNISNPLKYVDKKPVGTGPYMLESFSPQKIVLKANPNYWQKGEPKIKYVVYRDYVSSSALTVAMQRGQVDWTSAFAPNITSMFVSKNPNYNHYWFPQGQPVTLLTNDALYPFNMSFFRQAISVSINRTQLQSIGEYGYEKPANAAGLLSQQLNELNSTNAALAKKLAEFNITYAKQILEKHGFTINSKGRLVEPNGTVMPTINLMTIAGYPDWDTDISLIAHDLNKLGITVSISTPTQATVASDVTSGNYQMALDVATGIGPNAWYDYSGLTGPVINNGSNVATNQERWNSTGTGFMTYYNNYQNVTNTTTQGKYINHMASIMLKQMPVDYLVYSADWFEYINSSIGGWPTAKNPYWIPMPWYPGPNEVVMLHLYIKHAGTNNGLSAYEYYIIGGVIVAAMVGTGAAMYLRKKKIRGEE